MACSVIYGAADDAALPEGFASLTTTTQPTAQALIDDQNTSQSLSFGKDGVEIGDVLPNQLKRIEGGNPWHAYVSQSAVLLFGQLPTITYTNGSVAHVALHDAFKKMELVTDEMTAEGKHVAVDGQGLATCVWAFAATATEVQKEEAFKAMVTLAKQLASENKALPISGLQAKGLALLLHPEDSVKDLLTILGFTEVEGPWDHLYDKPRILMMLDLQS